LLKKYKLFNYNTKYIDILKLLSFAITISKKYTIVLLYKAKIILTNFTILFTKIEKKTILIIFKSSWDNSS